MTCRWPAGVTGLLLLISAIGAHAQGPKRVLILNPFSRDAEPFASAVSSFRSTLARDLGGQVDFHEIPLDLARFTGTNGEEPLTAFLEERIKAQPVDLVVPIGGAGVQFAARHRDRLFAATPVVAVAAEPRMIPPGFLENNATLVTQKIDLPGAVEDMLQMQPETKRIAVVFGSSPLEKIWAGECRREFAAFSDRVEFIWLDDLPLEEMLARSAALPSGSFIFHGLFLTDSNGIPCEKNLALRRLHEVARAPLYACFTSEFGLGPIGGRLFQNSEIGTQGAHAALRVLQGEPAGMIPPRILPTPPAIYDWRELRRWNIDQAGLPADRVINFREPDFWERYRWPVAGALLFGALQAALIIGLMVNRSKRRRTEAEATLIADISSRFVNLPAAEVDREIIDAQRRICTLMGFDLSVLWQWSDRDPGSFAATHLYSLEHGPQPPIPMSEDDFPWVRREILAGRVVAHRSIDDLPPEAAKDKEGARQFGIKSHLTLPLSVGGGSPLGIVGFNTTRTERDWPAAVIERLQLVAQIIANALARKRADHELRESELRQSLAADSAEAGLWELDWNSRAFWVSEKARTIFGYTPDESIPMARFEERVHPEDLQSVHECIHRAVTAGEPIDLEYRIRPGDGGERWIVSRGRPFFKASGEPERLLGLSMDITARKGAEERVNQLSHAVEQSPVLVVITDLKGRIVYVNRKFSEVTGYDFAECRGQNPRILKSGEAPASTYKELWATIIVGKTWRGEFHNRRKNGELYWERAVISPLIDHTGKVTHYVGIKEDITDAKLAEAALRESEELNRLTFEQAAVGIAHVGIDGRWLRVNDRLCEIVGYPREELMERTFRDVTHPDDLPRNLDHMRQILDGEIPSYGLEKRYLRKDGATVWVNLNVSLVRGEGSRPKHFISVLEDITEQKKAEQEVQELSQTLAHTGRVTLLGNLASALAHELSQPLGAILRNAEAAEMMLQDSNPDWEEMKAIITDILRDDQRAGQVIDKLRSLLKRGALELQPVDLSAVISEVLSLVQADAIARKVTLVSFLPPALPMVRGDRIHLQQVLLNLLTNAMDALGDDAAADRTVEVHASIPDGVAVEVRVSDNGPGISPADFGRLFEPFFTTKSTGMGMGLPMSKSIIEAQKGRLWAENRPEGGACFHFTLPVVWTDPPEVDHS